MVFLCITSKRKVRLPGTVRSIISVWRTLTLTPTSTCCLTKLILLLLVVVLLCNQEHKNLWDSSKKKKKKMPFLHYLEFKTFGYQILTGWLSQLPYLNVAYSLCNLSWNLCIIFASIYKSCLVWTHPNIIISSFPVLLKLCVFSIQLCL